MKKNKWFYLAATTLILSACGSDSEQLETVQQVELRLSSSLDLQSRTAYTKTQDQQIVAGEKVYAWVDEVNSTGNTEFIHAWELTADGYGNFTGETKYYPFSGHPVNIYAVHGNIVGITPGTTTFPTLGMSHTVSTNQNALTPTNNFVVSDLLYASASNCARQSAAHNLQFSHLLSKIEVYLVAGTGTTDEELQTATVTILNTKPAATLTLSKTAAPVVAVDANCSVVAIAAKMQTQTDQTVTIESVEQNAHRFAEAVIVPQWVNTTGASDGAAIDFIQVSVGTSSYKAQINKEFTAGNKYVYNVVVNKSGLTLTSTITQWGDGGTQIISAI